MTTQGVFKVLENEGTTPTPLTTGELGDAIPATISTDPVFQEIAQAAEAVDQRKRGYNHYDPRHSRVYAHKYKDQYSNWYYFRSGY